MMLNNFDFSGEIVYIRNLDRGYCKSFVVKGASCAPGSMTSQVVELKCLVPDRLMDDAGKISLYDKVSVSGHIETWSKPCGNGTMRLKTMFIVDYIFDEHTGGKYDL